MRVVGYIRVSTEEQASTGVSLQAQEQKLRQYAALYDLDLVEVVIDAGVSAKSLNRQGLQNVLEALKTGKAEGVVIAKLDRLTRSVGDWAHLIDKYFAKKYALLSVSDQIDTRSASGRLALNIIVSVATWEREAIGERTSAALQYKKSQGFKLGGKPLSDVLAINLMKEMRAGGATLAAIAQALSAQGFKTQKGGGWFPSTVKAVLDREMAA